MAQLRTLAVLFVLAACDRPDSEAAAAQQQQLTDTCTQLYQRQRACTDSFIPALVDLRQQLDKPSGISKAPRAEVIAAALDEWKVDSTDEAIAAQCDRMASELPVAEAKRCASLNACGELVPCVLPLVRARLER